MLYKQQCWKFIIQVLDNESLDHIKSHVTALPTFLEQKMGSVWFLLLLTGGEFTGTKGDIFREVLDCVVIFKSVSSSRLQYLHLEWARTFCRSR